MMETSQTLIDSLTDHLALFHSSRARNSNSIQPRAAILRWFSSLSVSGRRAALTILDCDLISVILNMLSYLHRHGHCFFFLLTDTPSPPSVLYRRSRGLLARAAAGHVAETELGESILLFSSGELGNPDPDTVTVSEDFISDIGRFVEVMDAISGGRFLTEEENMGTGKAEKWPELAWLKDKGYYSLESYIANRLEIALRISWREANRGCGGRKGRGGKGVKDKASVATSGMAANAFWRKKGCLDWWTQLDQRERQKVFDVFVWKASTTMVNEIVKESEDISKNMRLFFNHQLTSSWETLKKSFFKGGRYSSTSDDISLLPYRRKMAPHIMNRLTVLYTISVLKRDISHYGGNWLIFTTLAMAGSISDYVMTKLREVLMVVSVECTNLELLEDVGTSKSCVVVQNKGKKSTSRPRKPKAASKSSKANKLDGVSNKCSTSVESSSQNTMSSVKEETKGSLITSPIQQKPQETSVSEINKAENAKALAKDEANPAKKKNKRKGRKKNASSLEVKNQQTNRAKKLNTSVNFGPLNTTPAEFSKERTDASQVFDNSHNLTNALNGMEPDKCLENSGKIADSVTSNNILINKRAEQEAKQIDTCEKVEEMRIPSLTPLNEIQDIPKPIPDPRHPLWEGGASNFDMPFAPPTTHHVLPHPPLALPFSYDWPPVYRNYDRMSHNFGLANDFIDDSEAYYLSEEEMDYNFSYSERGYNQFFGGGLMYWSPADYGSGNGNGSLCSDDSAWAWHEADVNRVVEEMTVLPSLSPSPSTRAASIAGSDNGLEDSKPVLAPVKSSGNSSCGDTLPYMLRPINVPSGITRRGSRSELKPGQEYHRSPCIPSSARRAPSRVKRPPSPVVLCVPQVPRPPPPSPAGEFGRRRAGGWPVARSGSSSPRNWGMRGAFSEEKGFVEKGQVLLEGPEVVWPKSGLTMIQPFQGTPVLQEHLMKITQFSRDQQHPDITLPLQPPNSINCDSRLVMHNLLHEEIDYFCKQVHAGNLKRKPYVTWAINRVTRCLQELWPRSRTSLFGSNATGLALPTSDVDLVISLPPVRNLEPIKEAGILEGRNGIKETCLQHAARHLLNQEWVRNDSLKTVENTAIPVIMLEADIPSDINLCNDNPLASDNLQEGQDSLLEGQGDSALLSDACSNSKTHNNCTTVESIRLDISFKSPSHTGLQTSELVRELIQQFPASVPLALVLKKVLADRSLDHPYSGGLSSYCLVLLITRFLQHEHHLGQPIKQNLGSLLMDFLYFFGNVFDPRQMRISIRGSGLYMNRERGHSIDPIHIDDPLYPANNVGRNCFRIHQCIKAFADAFSLLESEIETISGECAAAITASKLSLLRKIIPTIDCNE